MSEITRILSAIEKGEPQAVEQLLPVVYEELRRLAAQKMAQEAPSHTLQATALVHEAYLRVVQGDQGKHWDGRKHFFASAAEAMRRILIDPARHKKSAKRGGDRKRVPLDNAVSLATPEGEPSLDLLALDDALKQLEAEDPIKAQLVKLRYFTGTSLEETAQLLDISPATAKRHWVYARSWLFGKLNGN